MVLIFLLFFHLIEPKYIFDNYICKYNHKILPFSDMKNVNLDNVIIIYTMDRDSEHYENLLNKLKESNVNFIKMNIEGSELQALKGSQNTIKKWKPRLAIAAYHKTWDLWEVPLILHEMNSSYRFYLRSYMNNLSFVYYVI